MAAFLLSKIKRYQFSDTVLKLILFSSFFRCSVKIKRYKRICRRCNLRHYTVPLFNSLIVYKIFVEGFCQLLVCFSLSVSLCLNGFCFSVSGDNFLFSLCFGNYNCLFLFSLCLSQILFSNLFCFNSVVEFL